MSLIDGPAGALHYASAQRPRGLAGYDVQINPADPYSPWMETGIIDYGISELPFYRIGYGPCLGWE
jgi:hypothetical protein